MQQRTSTKDYEPSMSKPMRQPTSPPARSTSPPMRRFIGATPEAAAQRGSLRRWASHDYASWGFYLITFSTEPRRPILSRIEDYRAIPSRCGEALEEAWLKMAEECPQITLREYAIMPDHFHGIVSMEQGASHPLGWWVRRAKARATHAIHNILGETGQFFEENFHDWVSVDAEMFEAFREYTSANPRREQLRRENRNLLKTVREARHPRLSAAAPNLHWDCLGDLALLDYPALLPIVVSRRVEESERQRTLAGWIEKVRRGAIPIGGFISPGEKAALKAFAALPRTRIIRLLPYGLKDFRPHGRQLESLASSRLLILSAFPEEVEGCNWDNCHWNNRVAAAVAAAAPLP